MFKTLGRFLFHHVTQIGYFRENMSGEEIDIYGRVFKKKKMKNVTFLEILSKDDAYLVVIENEKIRSKIGGVNKGSVIRIKGLIRDSEISTKYQREVIPNDIEILSTNLSKINYFNKNAPKKWSSYNNIEFLLSDKKRLLIEFRSLVLHYIDEFFYERNFIRVSSPKITNDIVNGPTVPFALDYYGSKKHLSISNVLYHHILVILGYNEIYEISPIFRQQKYGTQYQLSEFWVVDFSQGYSNRNDMINTLEDLLYTVLDRIPSKMEDKLMEVGVSLSKIPDNIDIVEYDTVLKWLGLSKDEYGTHIPKRLTKFLDRNGIPMIWIIDAPSNKKPFFLKRKEGKVLSAELWTNKVPILASGGERVTSYEEALLNLDNQGLDSDGFVPYLEVLKFGSPPSYTIGMGLERFLQYTTGVPLYYLVPFPRFANSDFWL